MRRYWAVGLALALAGVAGCSSGGHTRSPSDAGPDANALDTAADRPADADAAPTHDVANDRGSAGSDGAATDADARPDTDATLDRRPDAAVDVHISSFCDLATQTVDVPSAPIAGVLTGPSRNPAVSCHSSVATGGPEVFLSLKVEAYTIVDLRVDSMVDTLIAVRTGCGDDVAEIGCGDQPPPPDGTPSDGGTGVSDGAAPIDAKPANLRTSSLRVGLAAGSYTVIIDTLTLGTLTSAPFTLTTRVVAPATNASCAAPTLLTPATPSTHGKLDFAGQPTAGCGNATGGALFYTVGVPAGQRLTVRATPTAGDRGWMPRLTAFVSCAATTCLAQGHSSAGATQQLDWVNNGSNWRLVTVSVASDGSVMGAEFDIAVNTTDLLANCSSPTPVHDGTTLHNLTLQDALPSSQTCEGANVAALYYVATLLPQQSISVSATPTNPNLGGNINVALRTACDDGCATPNSFSQGAGTVNLTSASQTLLIEVTAQVGSLSFPFDLTVSLPPPPAGITVTPTGGLVTTESGGQATFQVVLTSPPTASVGLNLTSDTPSEGTVSPAALAFDATNWSQPQTVTVTGVDDQVSDGSKKYLIVTSAAVSADTRYAGMNASDVHVINRDNDPGLFVEGADDLSTSESGATATFTVRLDSQPTGSVQVPLSTSDAGEGTVSPASLTFTTANWNLPQLVTVTGVDDSIVDGVQTFTVGLGPLVSADTHYGGQHPAGIVVHNRDDDFSPVALKLLSGAHSCNFPGHVPVAVDDLGTLYVLMACDGQLALVTSTNGGATFSDLLPIPGTSNAQGDFSLATGRGGAVHVLFAATDTNNLVFLRTTNAGLTWDPPQVLSTVGDGLRLAAAGGTIIVTANGPGSDVTGNPNTLLRRSDDDGVSFQPAQTLPNQTLASYIQADGRAVFLVDNNGDLSGSTDAGATFKMIGTVNSGCCAVLGTQDLYTILDGEVALNDLVDTTQGGDFTGPAGTPMAVTIDDADVLTIFNLDSNSHLIGSRFGTDKSLSAPKTIGPQVDLVGAAPLSRKAIAIVTVSGTLTLFSVATWP